MTDSLAQKAINECRRILNASRSDTFYDLRMTPAERGVLLKAAGLTDDLYHRGRKFSTWRSCDQAKIKQAAKNASGWAAGLEVVL